MSNVKFYMKRGSKVASKVARIVDNAKRRLNRHLRKHPKDKNAVKYLESLTI